MSKRTGNPRGRPPAPPAVPGCLLGKRRETGCIGESCRRCGWNVAEHKRRVKTMRTEGLTEGPDGLKRLIVRRGDNG